MVSFHAMTLELQSHFTLACTDLKATVAAQPKTVPWPKGLTVRQHSNEPFGVRTKDGPVHAAGNTNALTIGVSTWSLMLGENGNVYAVAELQLWHNSSLPLREYAAEFASTGVVDLGNTIAIMPMTPKSVLQHVVSSDGRPSNLCVLWGTRAEARRAHRALATSLSALN
jgi:hypothetical protein